MLFLSLFFCLPLLAMLCRHFIPLQFKSVYLSSSQSEIHLPDDFILAMYFEDLNHSFVGKKKTVKGLMKGENFELWLVENNDIKTGVQRGTVKKSSLLKSIPCEIIFCPPGLRAH